MKRFHVSLLALAAVCAGSSAWAAALGRRTIGGLGEVEKDYTVVMAEGRLGLELDFAWQRAYWDVGDDSLYDETWMPRASLFYGISDFLDFRACVKYVSLEDGEHDLSLMRAGIGAKGWIHTGTDWTPYVGALLNYYVLHSDSVREIAEGMFGVSGEAGICYQVSDAFLIRLGAEAEGFLGEADGGEDGDIPFAALSVGLGATILF